MMSSMKVASKCILVRTLKHEVDPNSKIVIPDSAKKSKIGYGPYRVVLMGPGMSEALALRGMPVTSGDLIFCRAMMLTFVDGKEHFVVEEPMVVGSIPQ